MYNNDTALRNHANSFWGDVVLDTFNNVYREEDNILDQIYVKQIRPYFYYGDFWFSYYCTKMHINIELWPNPNFMSSFF